MSGFRTQREALQFEWAVKHAAPRRLRGLCGRIHKLGIVLNRERWTSRACLAAELKPRPSSADTGGEQLRPPAAGAGANGGGVEPPPAWWWW